MVKEEFVRTASLIGEENVQKLTRARVLVFGVGGVGGYVCEALARSGVGYFRLVDFDTVALSNVNRQIVATRQTVGRKKTDVMKERIVQINPEAVVEISDLFFAPDSELSFDGYDYVVDAIDSVKSKAEIVCRAIALNTPVISAMGAGNKLDPTAFKVADISKTKVCPLAKAVRSELKKRGVEKGLKTVYSEELPVLVPRQKGEKLPPSSISFVPSVMGLIMAGEIVKDLIK